MQWITLAENVTLVTFIVWARFWRVCPIFSAILVFELPLGPMLTWMYYSPAVSKAAYHAAWQNVDILCLLLEIVFVWELARGGFYLPLMPCFAHILIKFMEYVGDARQSGTLVFEARRYLNLIIIVACMVSIYTWKLKENSHVARARTEEAAS